MIQKAFSAIVAALCLLAISCASQKPSTGSSTSLSSKNDPASDMPIPPKDAQYTIYCQALGGPDHIARARALRELLQQNTPLKDWYVVHSTNQSILYYGFYRSIDPRDPTDASEGKRALTDLHSIRTMLDTNGSRPFSESLPVQIATPDPTANPAWDLTRSGAYWSLEIGVYKDSPQRKQAAVDAVREARAQGIEAYYYHGETSSSVCIGAWPQQAAREIDASAQNSDPDVPLYVTPQPLTAQAAKGIEARGIKPVAPQVQIIDPTLLDTMRRFPEHAINGEVLSRKAKDTATGHEILQPESSYLVKGPFVSPDDDGSDQMAVGAPPPPVLHPTPPDAQPGMGKLKSIGD